MGDNHIIKPLHSIGVELGQLLPVHSILNVDMGELQVDRGGALCSPVPQRSTVPRANTRFVLRVRIMLQVCSFIALVTFANTYSIWASS